MIDGDLYDFTIAIDYAGDHRVIGPAEGYAEWFAPLHLAADRFRGLPDEPGVYRVIAKFREGRRTATSWTRHEFTVLQYESMRLVGSGNVMPVIRKAE